MRTPEHPETPANRQDNRTEELSRATLQLTSRLTALGIGLDGSEGILALREIADGVERFEDAVEARGGDLMVDEPPRGAVGQPDNPDFVLPRRTADETVRAYLGRLRQATERVLAHARPG